MQVEQQAYRGQNPQFSPITAKNKVQTSASLEKGGNRRANVHQKKFSREQGYWKQSIPLNQEAQHVRTSSQQIVDAQRVENEFQDSIIGDSIDSENNLANFGQVFNPAMHLTENRRDNLTFEGTQQTAFGKLSGKTDNSIYSLKDQIKVCNIIQKRFVKQGQNQRINAQGLAKGRIQQKFISRVNGSGSDEGIDANVNWPQNVPGLSRPPILDKISTKGQLSSSAVKARGSSRKSKFEMDEGRFGNKSSAVSRMAENRHQPDDYTNKYNSDWKVNKDHKTGSMMSANKYGGPQVVRAGKSTSQDPELTTSPNVNKRTNVKLDGIDTGTLRGPLFKTADRGTIQTTEPDAMSSPLQVEKLRNTQKSTITNNLPQVTPITENQAQTVEEILDKLKQKYDKNKKKDNRDPSSGVQMVGKTQWQIPSHQTLKESYKKNEKEKMNSYITNLSNNQSDMEGHTLAREFYLKQKKKMEKTEQQDKLQEYVHNFSDAADLINVRSADNSSPNKMMGFAAAIKMSTQKNLAMHNTGNAILDMMRGFKRKRELMEDGLTAEEAEQADVQQELIKHTVFDKSLEEESKTMNNIAQDLLRKVKYQKIYKSNDFERATVPFNRGVLANDDPRIKFFQECRQELDVCLPILDKILRKTIYLQDYSLSDGHCKGLAVACQFFDPKVVNRILFSNCGVNGDQFAMILEGLAKLNDFKAIIYKMNGINQKSIDSLGPLLSKRLPHHLEELKIIDCKMSGSLIESLIKLLMKQSQLRKLALINILHSDGPFLSLVEYLQGSKHLEELDISWSTVRPQTTRKLIEALKDNKQLTCLSLGFNQLLSVQNNRDLTKEEIEQGITEVPLRQENVETMQCFLEFIKYNPYLIHLDLQSCGLEEPALRFIGKMLTRSQSLRSIHLCNNPGISRPMIEWLKKRIRAADLEEPYHIKGYKNDGNSPDLGKKKSGMQAAMLKYLGLDANHVEKEHEKMKKIRQGLKLRNVVASKRMNQLNQTELMRPALFEETSPTEVTSSDSSKLIIVRHLGYKAMIPGDAQWKILTQPQDECWHCGQHILTLFIWTPRIGQLSGIKDKQMIKYYKDHIEDLHAQDFLPSVQKAPQIASSFTNWKYKEMRKVVEFCQENDPYKPDFITRLMDEGVIRRELKGKENIRKLLQQHEKDLLDRQEEAYYKENWSTVILEIMRYKHPLIANVSNITSISQQMAEDQDVYFHIDWVKPGRHVYAVEHTPDEIYLDEEDQKEGKQMEALKNLLAKEHGRAQKSTETFYLHEMLAGFRLEDVPHYCKTRQMKQIHHDFYKPKPVFATFVKDTPEILAQCMNADKRLLRMEKFMDENDDATIVDKHISNNYQVIKDIYTMLQASSKTYPFIDTFTFRHYFVQELGLMNDGFYVMANFDNILSKIIGHNAKNMIDGVIIPVGSFCRYQFMELCLRMSKFLYTTGYMYRRGGRLNDQSNFDNQEYTEVSMQRAFFVFIEEILVPYYRKIQHKFAEFREQQIWDKDVETMFTMNEKALHQLYRMYGQMNQGKNGKPHTADFMTVYECVQLMKYDSPLKLTRATIRQAFALCKMSVINELDKKSQVTYIQITYVEFLEFLARIAELHFKDTEMEELLLSEKIGFMLDDLLTVVGCERVVQKIVIEEFSESDDDY